MRTKLNGLLTLLLAFVVHVSFAQDKTISGTVTDGLPDFRYLESTLSSKAPPTVPKQILMETTRSVQAEGQTLLFTYIGQRDVRRAVGAGSTINVQMEEDARP